MAWDEWEQLKTQSAEQQSSTQMQLNGVPEEDRLNAGSPQGDLTVNQKDLAAIGDEAFKLYNRLWKEARVADTYSTGSDLASQGFALGGALTHVSSRWDKQLGSVMDACALISNHMDFTKNAHAGDEIFIERHVSSIYSLDKGFDESYAPPGEKNGIYGAKDKKDEKD